MAFNLQQIFAALRDCDYVVVGGIAVLLHGHLRTTRDLDLVLDLDPTNCRKALDALAAIGLKPRLPIPLADFADPAKRLDWHQNRNMLVFPLWDPANPIRAVDLFVQPPIPFDTLLRRSVIKTLHDVPIRVAAIEDLVAMKEDAGRSHDLEDIDALRIIAANKVPTDPRP